MQAMVLPLVQGFSDLVSERLWATHSHRKRCMSLRHRLSITRHSRLFTSRQHLRSTLGRCTMGIRTIKAIAANGLCRFARGWMRKWRSLGRGETVLGPFLSPARPRLYFQAQSFDEEQLPVAASLRVEDSAPPTAPHSPSLSASSRSPGPPKCRGFLLKNPGFY
jgi:hypothetical protein